MLDSPGSVELESERILTGLARGRFGRIAPELIARHLLASPADADWPVRKAAFDALARRYGFAQRDELRVAERPDAGPFGVYTTRSRAKGKSAEPRPYQTALYALAPLRTSCSCADFVRSSLGLCKHGLTVLESLDKDLTVRSPEPDRSTKPLLRWLHDHPLQGSADRLERLEYTHAGNAAAPSGFRSGKPTARVLRETDQRLAFISELERAIKRGTIAAEPAVLTLLSEENDRATRKLADEPLVATAMKSLGTLGRKLYPYQREGVKRFFETGRLLLADDMGLGKTTQAIAACHGLLTSGRIKRGLLIVPAALKPQWKREWDATTDVPLTLVDGSPKERAKLYQSTKHGFLVLGYEQLLRDFALVLRFAPEMVVLDEAQRIKNWATKSAAYVKALQPAYRLVLTGTPMENRFDELASIMDFVDNLALEPKWRLVPFHSVYAAGGGKGIGGARHLDVLRERLSGAMLRRVRKEVLTQLPSRTDTRVPVEMTDVQREQHDELRQPIAELCSKAQRRPLMPAEFMQLMQLLTRQRMICNGMAQVQFDNEWPRLVSAQPTPEILTSLFAPKLSVLRGLIEQVVVDQQRKAVVFSQWRKMLTLSEWAVRDLLQAAGMRAVFFTGADSPKARERAIVEFHDDPTATVMFLSDAGGVGLNLQRAASCCINLELPWNPAVLEQRIGRIYRLGQTLPIDVYNLVTEEGIESRIAKLLGQKTAVFSSLFDGTSDEVLFDGESSFLEGVKKLIDAVPVPLPEGPALEGEPAPTFIATPEPPQPPAHAPTSLADSGLRVTRLPDGGMRIEASAALAAPLAALLESLASSLRAGTH
jgi:SNF2 family DNA or RNA helicase